MTHADIIQAFGFQLPPDNKLESIYPYAPVYRLSNAQGQWIVKRTQKPLARGRAVAAWTQALARQGVPVITPALNFGENPRAFQLGPNVEEVWVIYPFITGSAYLGSLTEISAAGSLLGEIHAAGAQGDFGLKRVESIPAIEAGEIEEDVEAILQTVHTVFPEYTAQANAILAQRLEKYFQESSPRLAGTNLPLANCSWDYKASNLIYQNKTSPILIDADNAGCLPRAYDLAIAALLFHNEGKGTSRLFTRAEWEPFLAGYTRRVRFTREEKQAWNDLLVSAWIDEGLWLLRDDRSGWSDPRQGQLLLSLLLTDLSIFALVE